MKREKGQLWIKIFPDKPIHQKKTVRGSLWGRKGKGAPEYFVACGITRTEFMFEIAGVSLDIAKEALASCSTDNYQ